MSPSHHNFQNWILLALLTFIWGTSYILIKKGLVTFTAVELTSLRISLSFLCSLPFAIQALRKIPKEKYFVILQIGIFGSAAPALLFSTSMTHSDSAVNGILNSLSPIWTLVIGYFFFKLPAAPAKTIGVILGFLGALVLVLGKEGGNLQINIGYSLLPVLATFCYGMSTNITKEKLQDMNPLYTTSLAMGMIGLPALIVLLCSEVPAKIAAGNAWNSLAAVALLAIFGTFIAWILFYRLVQRTDALFAASVTYLIPIVAIVWGVRDGEVFSVIQGGGMVLILVGVYFTTSYSGYFRKKMR